MTPQMLNKHQIKTAETRELLLRAAEEIFVRDGYAGADLGEIANIAGRTKGAIYAQFKSKEDIFMALVEEQSLRYRSEMVKALADATSVEQNRAAFKKLCLNMSRNQTWNLLMLEFKLFAVRNPAAKRRFRKHMEKMISPDKGEERLSNLLGPLPKGQRTLSRSLSVQMMNPLLAAVTLESMFDPDSLSEEARDGITRRLFQSFIEEPIQLNAKAASQHSRNRDGATRRKGRHP
jgi:AcrR family transcriptional regulator